MDLRKELEGVLKKHKDVRRNPKRENLIKDSVKNKEAVVSANGALATWTPLESTGRSPADTYIVKREGSEKNIDWDSPNNNPIEPETFEMVLEDALRTLEGKKKIYVTERILGADVSYALPVMTVTDYALTSLFTYNMFRSVPKDLGKSIFSNNGFVLITLPYDKLYPKKYEGRLREVNGKTSNMVIAMDFDNRIGIVYGSAYGGSVKKLMFTVMNYLLPGEGILPIHCSANEGERGDVALLLGLSGTGKTTLSADPTRSLYGDDEHGWGEMGVANFEYGCYAKLINLDPKKEPEIYNAIMHKDTYEKHGAIVENAMIYPDGSFDFYDDRFTPNSRGSYPLSYLTNVKESSTGGHPKTILFLTADANGVLPPVSKLTKEQAMLWFLVGYTSKLAGTETGIIEPKTAFSRFFGEPFMPRNPDVYAKMLGEKLKKHKTKVYLINTGWSGGPYGIGKRIDIDLTRKMVHAALEGELERVEYEENETFHIMVPKSCPGVPSEILDPRNTWKDKKAYEERKKKLAKEFCEHFDKAYGNKGIDKTIERECPGK
ncbi:MAG: phosphoenolpyruvate carboxykinase (ATP) [Candidatus Aenigmarchaeota archaeon]|nr:phosphoenolpyruvate carboxykinase (ATP) [Candidatus Aenigmarchaeota archaeon]